MKNAAPVIDIESSNDSQDGEWITVPVRGVLRHDEQTQNISRHVPNSCNQETLIHRVSECREALSRILICEQFWERYSKYFQHYDELVAYGIGSISNSSSSLLQFALLLLIQEKLDILRVVFNEPALCDVDVTVIEQYGIHVNPESSIDVSRHIMCYMPHCDRKLYEHALYKYRKFSNHITLLSNRLTLYNYEFADWRKMNDFLSEEPMFIWKRDAEKYETHLVGEGKGVFKPKTAMRSSIIPFEAFNDLAFVRVAHAGDLENLIESVSVIWCRTVPR
jgi:hypothetical protein